MTGEITLRGRALQIGGLKEKVLAAHRGGIKTVLIPSSNVKDLPDIPAPVLQQLNIVDVRHMDEVLQHTLVGGEALAGLSDAAQAPDTTLSAETPLMG
jgi:ATP-dependent Lon protease